MPPATVKLIWSMAACNFCPRSDVRTCQIKPGKLLSKLSSALELDESVLDSSEGICTCCLADIDMIIRSLAIRAAMKDYYIDLVQNMNRGDNSTNQSQYYNGHDKKSLISSPASVEDHVNFPLACQESATQSAPPPPSLLARPPFSSDCTVIDKSDTSADIISLPSPKSPSSTGVLPMARKAKERMTRYQCLLCDKIAGSKSHCMEHLICHSPVRPFTCSRCMRTYKSRKACREHLIVMHGVEKIEENLQRLVLIDHEDLKQLEHVCTQYRRICSQSNIKIEPRDSCTPTPNIKAESDVETNGGSAWLFKPPPGTASRLPPPLLQCRPSTLSSADISLIDQKPYDEIELIPPPSKRNRKGTPHKLVHSSPLAELDSEACESENAEESFDNHEDAMDDDNLIEKPDGIVIEFPSKEPLCLDNVDKEPLGMDNVNQPYFPSFQPCKIEPSLPAVSRHSPTSLSRKSQPPCNVCGRQFPTKEKMADHMRSHSEIKQFSCLVCNRFFKYRRGVTNHLKEVHHMTDRVEISSKVASHELDCGVLKSPKGEHKVTTKSDNHDLAESISEKVIQDTLSSLADIRQTTDTAALPLQISSDESRSLPDADDSTFETVDSSSPNDHLRSQQLQDKPIKQPEKITFNEFPSLPVTHEAWPQAITAPAFPESTPLSSIPSGALAAVNAAARFDSYANKHLV